MGAETAHKAEYEHPDLGELIWTAWEYPTGDIEHQEYDLNGHKLIQNITVGAAVD